MVAVKRVSEFASGKQQLYLVKWKNMEEQVHQPESEDDAVWSDNLILSTLLYSAGIWP